MTRRKHEVDPTAQGAMLPPTAAALATGSMVEVEGAYYRPPTSEPEPLTPEQEAMKAEADALMLLGQANKVKHNITSMEKYQHNLKSGKVKEGTDIPSELARLASTDEETREPVGAIPTSQKAYRSLRAAAKRAFAKSIGIETVIVSEVRAVEGSPREVLIVRATNDEQNDRLNRLYRDFDNKYGGPNKAKARSSRRAEVLSGLRTSQ